MTRQILMELVFLSLSGTVLGLLLWLLRPLTRRLFSWKWHYYLWLAVLLRLALPVFAICGSESILIAYAQEPVEVELRSSWDLVSGDFKLAYVSPEGSVETLADQGEEEAVTVQLEPGRNVIRMAGREAILEKLSISVEGLDADKISQVYMTEEEENEAVYK